ncbi:hypothetical protein MC885_015534 [Smutsia gigantea]|nr:hypothetical protein MC885_015534 [Smutsia gigantea]
MMVWWNKWLEDYEGNYMRQKQSIESILHRGEKYCRLVVCVAPLFLLTPAMIHKVLLLTVLALGHGFNLDTETVKIFQENARGFGHSVVQLEGSRMVVGAPQEIKAVNQTGGLYQCDYSMATCEPIQLQVPPEAVNMSLGLSLAFATKPFRLLACGPTVHQTCKENTYVNGFCFLFGSNLLQEPQRFPEALRECPQKESDIAFLIDGSGSIIPNDFQRMKEFVSTYSEEFQTHFTFSDFKKNPNPGSLVLEQPHLSVCLSRAQAPPRQSPAAPERELFHSSSGARENALKILVVITDGEKFGDPLEYEDVIPEAEKEGLIRYVIGVGDAFNSLRSRQELNIIASKPARDYVFRVNNFEALKTIQNQLQEKIFAIEGYAAEVILRNRVQSVVLGAPRYQHTGLVAMFREFAGAWETNTVVKGSQIGSYFGASLCSVDMDTDGSSDLVLIGAPHYYEPTWGGQVSVCPLPRGRARWKCEAVLHGVQGHPWGRFGAALTALGDVNGDKLTDVAIGAPGEQENRGAVYIFHGTAELGISPSHSQRISGSQLSPSLQYFGQSLSGGQDLTMDGLVDLAVGAQGHALLLRSQPVLKVEVTMEFTPREVARNVFECREQVVRGQTAGEVNICFRVRKNTRDRLREGEGGWYCVEDSVTPIVLLLNFSLLGEPSSSYGNLRPVLALDAQRLFTASFPFEQNCGSDGICQDDLSISFSLLSLDTLVVGGPRDLNVTLTVRNEGEDSYWTHVNFFHPPDLSYRRVSAAQNQRRGRSWRLTCESGIPTNGSGDSNTSNCSINHPIFPNNSEFNNLGQRSLPVTLVFWVPIQLNQFAVWDNLEVTFSKNLSSTCHYEKREPPQPNFLKELKKTAVLSCSVAVCQRIKCDIPFFNILEKVYVTLKGNLSFDWYIKALSYHLQVVSVAEILFDESKFALLPGQGAFLRAQTGTRVERVRVHDPVPLIVGSSVGGLVLLALITAGLYKVFP